MTNHERYELARALYEESIRIQRASPRPHKYHPTYYFFNITHPAIKPLYEEFKRSRDIRAEPISDTERTEFELSLLGEDTLQRLRAFCGECGEQEKTHCPPAQR